MVREVKAFQTSDNKVHDTLEAAQRHEIMLEIHYMVDIFGGYHTDEIRDFIKENFDRLCSLFVKHTYIKDTIDKKSATEEG